MVMGGGDYNYNNYNNLRPQLPLKHLPDTIHKAPAGNTQVEPGWEKKTLMNQL